MATKNLPAIKTVLLIIFCFFIKINAGQAQAVESTSVKAVDTTAVIEEIADSIIAQIKAPIVQVPVTLKRLIIPGALFAYGALSLNIDALKGLNREIKEVVWDHNPHSTVKIEDYTLLVPAVAVYALNLAGLKGQNNLVDRSIIYGMSNLIANGLSFGIKKFGAELRPDSSSRTSFPSGHTAEAFVSAEFFHQEYKGRVHWTVIAAGYAIGVGTAYLRMYNNKHWFGDVVAGAGIGMASTRFAYYLYPLAKHLIFGSKKTRSDAMILPTYQNGRIGFAGVLKF